MSRRTSNQQAEQIKFAKLLAQARAAMKQDAWYQARKAMDKANICCSSGSERRQVMALYRQLDAEGQKLLKDVDRFCSERKYLQAIDEYRRIARIFGSTPSAVSAGRSLRELQASPEVQCFLDEAKAKELSALIDTVTGAGEARAAATRPSAAESAQQRPQTPNQIVSRVELVKSLPVKKQARVVELLAKTVKRYPASDTGKKAAKDLASLRSDEAFQGALSKYLLEAKGGRLYKAAEAYYKGELHARALHYCERIVQEFPDTEAAAEAERMIAAIEAGRAK